MKIIYKELYKKYINKEIADNPEKYKDEIQTMIGGKVDYLWLPHKIKLLYNVDGKSLNLHPNIPVDHDFVFGNVIFIGSDRDENFASISELQEAYIRKNFF